MAIILILRQLRQAPTLAVRHPTHRIRRQVVRHHTPPAAARQITTITIITTIITTTINF
jgi:hypothetical protein